MRIIPDVFLRYKKSIPVHKILGVQPNRVRLSLDIAGTLQVPVLLVGDKVLSGYNRSALLQALTESGHIKTEPESK